MERQFKPPSLRNLFGRGPFMHAVQFATLEEVPHHYNTAPTALADHSELDPLESRFTIMDPFAFSSENRPIKGGFVNEKWL
jgi:cytochrome c peroxidase